MQPNVIVAEASGHRARFAWLGIVLAATVALLVTQSEPRAVERDQMEQIRGAAWKPHHCYKARKRAEHAAARRADREVRELEQKAREAEREAREAERAARRAGREAERIERIEREVRRQVERERRKIVEGRIAE